MKRIVVIGASGVFGARLCRMIAAWPDAQLVLAARRAGPLEALAATLPGRPQIVALDRDAPDMAQRLSALAPFAVADAAGPFQGADHGVARAAIAVGAHYVDLADGRAFVAGFGAALDAAARAAGVTAVTGASSTPGLSHAALEAMTADWSRIDEAFAAISPGARAPRGLSVMRAILSWAGQPVRIFDQGRWRDAPGWGGLRRVAFPGLGRRWASLAETPDLDLIPARFHPRRSGLLLAGLELSVLHLGLWLLSWPVRLRLIRSLVPLARPLRFVAGLLAWMGGDRGGMIVQASGAGPEGEPRWARWSLLAEAGAGPGTPAAPAAALLRALLDGEPVPPGAGPCAGLLRLETITAQLADLPIRTRLEAARPGETGLFPRLIAAFDDLPEPVQAAHFGGLSISEGIAVARGSPGLAALVRAVLGLPGRGRHQARVEITPEGQGERWTRRFGKHRFASHIAPVKGDPGAFEETAGPITFRFRPGLREDGFTWDFEGWRIGPIPLPRAFGPTIRARTFASGGVYRFSVLAAHPLAGLLFAYRGRLHMTNT